MTRTRRPAATVLTTGVLTAGVIVLTPLAASAATSGTDIAALATANVGKGAGSCSLANSTPNSLGGAAYGTSCTGNGGNAEYWCADFAKWVWQNSAGGAVTNASTLNAGAVSFYNYGIDNATLHTATTYKPQVGDAVVYDVVVPAGKTHGRSADHVGLVTSVNPDGSIETANGDFGGTSGSGEAYFAETSTVVAATIEPDQIPVGSTPSSVGMTISGYITPAGLAPSAPDGYLPLGEDGGTAGPYATDPYAADPYATDPYATDPYADGEYDGSGGYADVHGNAWLRSAGS
ncbi:CHAP domain-containing protein [Actinospica durhamensis]|uniref:CHAP domain-containing protein n=1 Tax=Actinospica durhamensis TaxID=1508375 RepID=A0A941EUV0_9ACTN|nr:CHAP domain-containing protein [Actinospica durhamensis]MBR7837411.1 CHAP domain-containing protein [Actinospica durhamensis]